MYEVRVDCASFLTGRHLLINKMDKNSQYTKHKNNENWKKDLIDKAK